MSEALNELGIYFNVSAGDSKFKRLFTAAVREVIADTLGENDSSPNRSDEQELIDKLHERLMYHENKHAFFNMGRFPQVGDRIQDLSMESKPLATIIALSVLSNGHAVASVSYDDAEIKGTRFNFCNHGSTWQLLYDAPRAEKKVCSECGHNDGFLIVSLERNERAKIVCNSCNCANEQHITLSNGYPDISYLKALEGIDREINAEGEASVQLKRIKLIVKTALT